MSKLILLKFCLSGQPTVKDEIFLGFSIVACALIYFVFYECEHTNELEGRMKFFKLDIHLKTSFIT